MVVGWRDHQSEPSVLPVEMLLPFIRFRCRKGSECCFWGGLAFSLSLLFLGSRRKASPTNETNSAAIVFCYLLLAYRPSRLEENSPATTEGSQEKFPISCRNGSPVVTLMHIKGILPLNKVLLPKRQSPGAGNETFILNRNVLFQSTPSNASLII